MFDHKRLIQQHERGAYRGDPLFQLNLALLIALSIAVSNRFSDSVKQFYWKHMSHCYSQVFMKWDLVQDLENLSS